MKINDIVTSEKVGYFINNSGFDNQLYKKHNDDAGLDLCVDLLAPVIIYSGEQELIIENDCDYDDEKLEVVLPARSRGVFNTRTKIKLPDNHVGLIWDRSGLAADYGISIAAGCIDVGYIGYIKLVIHNHSDVDFVVKDGYRMAQLLCLPCNMNRFIEVDSFEETDRGSNGFSSTGLM